MQAMLNNIRSILAEMCRDVEMCVRVCAHVRVEWSGVCAHLRVEWSVRVCVNCAPACPVCSIVSEASSVAM